MVEAEDVRVVKLVSGEEFFAEVEEIDGGKRVKNPLTLAMVPTEKGTIGVKFDHWLGYTKDPPQVDLKEEHIMYCEPVLSQFAELYCQQFNKIFTPQKGGIVTP